MLRALVVVLALANLGFYAWTQGWLDGVVGVRARGDREPERLARQLRPETVKILPPESASSPASSPAMPAPAACLEAGPFTPAQAVAAEAAVQATVPRGQWAHVKTDQPGSWIIYMGKYASHEAQAKKEDELKRRRFAFEEVDAPPDLEPGLSLGRFADRALADKALAQFASQGVRTARVVELAAPTSQHLFRVERADVALAHQLASLKVDALGKGFSACAVTDAATR